VALISGSIPSDYSENAALGEPGTLDEEA